MTTKKLYYIIHAKSDGTRGVHPKQTLWRRFEFFRFYYRRENTFQRGCYSAKSPHTSLSPDYSRGENVKTEIDVTRET